MSRLGIACDRAFGRHESFYPRYGWLKKAVDQTWQDPEVFASDEGPLRLGVGRNMVKSIRYWGLATKVLAEQSAGDRRRRGQHIEPSRFGALLFADDEDGSDAGTEVTSGPAGLDPYLEHPASLWLLHWRLLATTCLAPVWWATFNLVTAVEVDKDSLATAVDEHLQAVSTWRAPKPRTLERDLECLLRMYAPSVKRHRREPIDDLLDSPFRELGLLSADAPQGRFRFVIGEKPTLDSLVVAYACLDYLARHEGGRQTVTLSTLAGEPGSPGRVFKLADADVEHALERAASQVEGLELTRPAGVRQLTVEDQPQRLAASLLALVYKRDADELVDHAEALAGYSSDDGHHAWTARMVAEEEGAWEAGDEPSADPIERMKRGERRKALSREGA